MKNAWTKLFSSALLKLGQLGLCIVEDILSLSLVLSDTCIK